MRAIAFSLTIALAAGSAYAADTRLIHAVKANNSSAAVTLLQQKVDVNAAEADGTTALHWAVRNDDATLVDRLIRAGANVTAANRYGVTDRSARRPCICAPAPAGPMPSRSCWRTGQPSTPSRTGAARRR
jgi:hypothetical protein